MTSQHEDYATTELLERETDEELPGASQIPTMPVCVTEKVITEPVTPQAFTTHTILLSTATISTEGNGIDELLPKDELRVRATVLAVDQDIVICHSKAQAGSPSNSVAAVPAPEGFYLPKGIAYPLNTTQRVWVAAVSAAANRISVSAERRQP